MADNKVGYRIKDIEQSQRPRERLEKQGASVLNDAELLAILLRWDTWNERGANGATNAISF